MDAHKSKFEHSDLASWQSFLLSTVSFFSDAFPFMAISLPLFKSPNSKLCCSWRNIRTHMPQQWHPQRRALMGRLTRMGSEGAVEEVLHCYAELNKWETIVFQSVVSIAQTHPDLSVLFSLLWLFYLGEKEGGGLSHLAYFNSIYVRFQCSPPPSIFLCCISVVV